MTRIAGLLLMIACVGCGPAFPTTTNPSPTPISAGAITVSSSDLAFCLSEVNRYRASIGRTPLVQSDELQAVASAAAQSDQKTNLAHGYFKTQSVAFAENEVLRLPTDSFASVHDLIGTSIASMWAEGPGGGHYDNIANARYTELGCGFYGANGTLTFVHDFR